MRAGPITKFDDFYSLSGLYIGISGACGLESHAPYWASRSTIAGIEIVRCLGKIGPLLRRFRIWAIRAASCQ